MLQLFTFIQARLAVLEDERGATATEYAILVGFIALALGAIVAGYMTFLDGKIDAVNW